MQNREAGLACTAEIQRRDLIHEPPDAAEPHHRREVRSEEGLDLLALNAGLPQIANGRTNRGRTQE